MLLDVGCRERSGAPTNLERCAVSLFSEDVSSLERGPVLLGFEEGRADHLRAARLESMRGVVGFAATGPGMPGWTQNGAWRTAWPAAA